MIVRLLSSNRFFFFVVLLTVFNGLWYAFSFQPILYDEGRHFQFINIYTNHASPFISNQLQEWDSIGEVTRDASYLYYYLMSLPLRLAELFTDNGAAYVIFLRLINLVMFVAGLFVYRKFLLKAGISKIVTNIVFLFLVITPSIAALPGAINYDNATFLLFALLLYLSHDVLRSKSIQSCKILGIILIGIFGSLVKFTFIALFAPVALFVAWDLFKKHRGKLPKLFLLDYIKQSKIQQITLIILLILGIVLFVERPVTNVLEYGQVAPSCKQVISEERCLQNFTERRNITAINTKPADFEPDPSYFYAVNYWIPNMIRTQSGLLPWKDALPMMVNLYTLLAFAGALSVLLYLRDFMRTKVFALMIVTMLFYSFVLFYQNYSDYEKVGQVVATSGRYFLPIMPIFLTFVAIALIKMFGKYKKALLVPLLVLMVLFTQGGGATTFLMNAQRNIYWKNDIVREANDSARDVVDFYIQEEKYKISPFNIKDEQ